MVDPHDEHCGCLVVDLVHHSVGSTSSRPQTGKLVLERMTDRAWGVAEAGEHELDGRRSDALGQPGQRPFRCRRDNEPIGR